MRSVLPLLLKNLNYLKAKVGGEDTRKFPPIPQIGGFRSIYLWKGIPLAVLIGDNIEECRVSLLQIATTASMM